MAVQIVTQKKAAKEDPGHDNPTNTSSKNKGITEIIQISEYVEHLSLSADIK